MTNTTCSTQALADFRADNTIMSRLETLSTEGGVSMELLVEITDFIALRAEAASNAGEQIADKTAFIEQAIADYFSDREKFFAKLSTSDEARNCLSDMVYHSIKRDQWKISLFGRCLTGFHPELGFTSQRDTLSFSTDSTVMGQKDDIEKTHQRYLNEAKRAMRDTTLSFAQRVVAENCLRTLERCTVVRA
ncbi:hypothetical protein [Vibrio mediterranei]|uniref:hypothetical protein n=1 Tax=Vibrio mediterranei TaxID=689 RepID=UPI004069620D